MTVRYSENTLSVTLPFSSGPNKERLFELVQQAQAVMNTHLGKYLQMEDDLVFDAEVVVSTRLALEGGQKGKVQPFSQRPFLTLHNRLWQLLRVLPVAHSETGAISRGSTDSH